MPAPTERGLKPPGRLRQLTPDEKINKTGVDITQDAILRNVGLEIDLVMAEGIKQAHFRDFLIKHPDILLEFKKATGGGSKGVPLELNDKETVKLIKAMALYQTSALLQIIGPEGCAKIKKLLMQKPGGSS